MLRNPSPVDGMLQWGRGLAVEKRQAPVVEIAMAGMTPPPRSKEGTHPGRFSHVRNAETPTESGRFGGPVGQPQGMAESSWREQDAQEANAGGRKPTGNHDVVAAPPSGRCWVTGRIPGSKCSGLERGADVGR